VKELPAGTGRQTDQTGASESTRPTTAPPSARRFTTATSRSPFPAASNRSIAVWLSITCRNFPRRWQVRLDPNSSPACILNLKRVCHHPPDFRRPISTRSSHLVTPTIAEVTESNQLLSLLVPQPEREGFQGGKQREGHYLLEHQVRFVTSLQIKVGNCPWLAAPSPRAADRAFPLGFQNCLKQVS